MSRHAAVNRARSGTRAVPTLLVAAGIWAGIFAVGCLAWAVMEMLR